MYKIIFVLLCISITINFYPQEIKLSSNRLLFSQDSVVNEITIYNIGEHTLIIDSIYTLSRSPYFLGYNLEFIVRDTLHNYFIFMDPRPLDFSIDPNDSANLIFGYPTCGICKTSSPLDNFKDTIVFHSNSLVNNYVYIYSEGFITDIKDENTLLNEFHLYQNYPNPFNPITNIKYYIPRSSFVTLKIYDMLGNEIKTLIMEEKYRGKYSVTWDGRNNEGKKVSSSIYFCQLEASGNKMIRKMILLK